MAITHRGIPFVEPPALRRARLARERREDADWLDRMTAAAARMDDQKESPLPATKKKTTAKAKQPIRYTTLKANSRISTAIKTIQDMLNLPEGSVHLVYQNENRARWNSTIGKLRKNWQE